MQVISFIGIVCVISFISCKPKSTSGHNFCEEYGYKGKVKQITKTTFSKSIMDDISKIPAEDKGDLNEIFYINPEGNIDSMITERTSGEGEMFSYRRVFHYGSNKRDSWEALTASDDILMAGKIDWQSDHRFEEKVFFPDGKLKAETDNLLSENFRLTEIKIKSYTAEGGLIQDAVQKIEHDPSGDIRLITTRNLQAHNTEVKSYQYLSKDVTGNPKQILVINDGDGTKSFVRLEYQYYE